MRVNELREMTIEELKNLLTELKGELFMLRFQHATNQLENPIKIRDTRKSIARVLTIITQKENTVA